MAQTRYVNTRFWKDNYISGLNSSDKLLFLYFLTNQNTNIAGIYEITLREVALDTGIDKEMVEKQLDKFRADGKIFYIDGFIIIRNFTRHQSTSPKIQQGIARIIDDLPDRLRKFLKVDDRGLWFDSGETKGDLTLLSSKINAAWFQHIADTEKQSKLEFSRRRQIDNIKREFGGR